MDRETYAQMCQQRVVLANTTLPSALLPALDPCNETGLFLIKLSGLVSFSLIKPIFERRQETSLSKKSLWS